MQKGIINRFRSLPMNRAAVLVGRTASDVIYNVLSLIIMAITGFIVGLALTIAIGQLPKLFGYSGTSPDFLGKVLELFERFGLSHWPTALLGAAMLVLLVAVMRFLPRLPGAFVVVAVSILLVKVLGLDQMGVAILGEVPAGMPPLVLPSFDPATTIPQASPLVPAGGSTATTTRS